MWNSAYAGCSRTEICLTPFEMRTQFVRQRRQDRHVAISAPFGLDDVNLWWIAVQILDRDVHKFTILRTSILYSRDLRGDRCPTKSDIEIGIE